ncbi:thioredoxin-domain-containing protein [Aulographum hederae CBS 113979]|uniref:Thioredoxin-domain-containing protein n=1 Tax=Aulographum hederae CBS 113979 TaxID=1176131 RepID=A0A6G1HC32_9PEZI|nr:thioredoxin-domain-containing protein [Aulographum hederae CBS 113979]
MFSSTVRRSILTQQSIRQLPTTATASKASIHNLYKPILSNKYFYSTMAEEGVHNLMSKADFDKALGEKGVMVLDCFATWCGPCKTIAPQVVKYSKAYPSARFYKLDVDEVPDVAQELGIRAMPTFIVFKDGEKSKEVVGANPKALEAAIKDHVEEAGAA